MQKELVRARTLLIIFIAFSGLLLVLFVREYLKHDEIPVGRLPLLVVSIGFLLYYSKRYVTLRHKK